MTRRAASFFVRSIDRKLAATACRFCRTDQIQHAESARMRSTMILHAPRANGDGWATAVIVGTFVAAIAISIEWAFG